MYCVRESDVGHVDSSLVSADGRSTVLLRMDAGRHVPVRERATNADVTRSAIGRVGIDSTTCGRRSLTGCTEGVHADGLSWSWPGVEEGGRSRPGFLGRVVG